MTIDIRETVFRTQLRRFLTLIAFCIAIIAVILLGRLGNEVLGMEKYSWALIVGLLYVFSLVVESVFELNYIYFTDEGKSIVLRYFSMSIFSRKKNSIEIPKKEFSGYQLQTSFRGLKKKIVLLQQYKGKDLPYPQVSITALSKKELKQLTGALDKWKVK